MDPDHTEEIRVSDEDSVEYFFASDASAIIEHTNRVIFLEDDDVAACKQGVLSIHRYRYIKLYETQMVSHLASWGSVNVFEGKSRKIA